MAYDDLVWNRVMKNIKDSFVKKYNLFCILLPKKKFGQTKVSIARLIRSLSAVLTTQISRINRGGYPIFKEFFK